jgi:hypothetical protein
MKWLLGKAISHPLGRKVERGLPLQVALYGQLTD